MGRRFSCRQRYSLCCVACRSRAERNFQRHRAPTPRQHFSLDCGQSQQTVLARRVDVRRTSHRRLVATSVGQVGHVGACRFHGLQRRRLPHLLGVGRRFAARHRDGGKPPTGRGWCTNLSARDSASVRRRVSAVGMRWTSSTKQNERMRKFHHFCSCQLTTGLVRDSAISLAMWDGKAVSSCVAARFHTPVRSVAVRHAHTANLFGLDTTTNNSPLGTCACFVSLTTLARRRSRLFLDVHRCDVPNAANFVVDIRER